MMVPKYIPEELHILLFPSLMRNFADESETLCQPNPTCKIGLTPLDVKSMYSTIKQST